MRVEKIELIGFKSFADKTTFNLHPGITCIVGPNGCGKSNIVDAFKWVLGEQSAKSLRGEKMEEVIFNGSASKKPKGMAEVTLHVAGLNPGGNGDSHKDTVAVTRRLYRSGESEYMINKTSCRLKDVKDIFLDTGLDFKGYSILEQGRIGEIINAKPIDRRFVIEEVAGVMKYKVRKAEALSKLESSRHNLTRINDIIIEIKKQINILDRLAKKAERYKRLSAEMHAIELKISRRDFHDISNSFARILDELSSLREKEAFVKAEITSIENRTETRRIQLLEKEKSLETVQNRFQAMERDIADIERTIAVGKNDIENLNAYRGRLSGQEEEIDSRVVEISSRCEELKVNAERLANEIELHAEELRGKLSVLRELEDELSDKEELIEDKRREIFKVTDELGRRRNEIGRHQSSLEGLERRESNALRESEDSRRILTEIEASILRVESEIQAGSNEILLLKEKKDVLGDELTEAKGRHDQLVKAMAAAREELASAVSRLDSLKEIVFDKPTREALASKGDIHILASVSDVFEVTAEYEKALESALADKADSFILGSFDEIEHAVLSLKGKDVGKSSFITTGIPSLPSYDLNSHEGIIGRALDFVKVKDGYSVIAHNLLGSILIVRDLKIAFELRPSDSRSIFVTPEGEVMEPSGAVIVGEGRGIFKRKREIRELEVVIADKKEYVETTNSLIREVQDIINTASEEIKTVESVIYGMEKELSRAKMTVEKYEEDRERTNRKLSYLTMEIEESRREKASLDSLIAEGEIQATEIQARKTAIEEETLRLQEGIAQKKSRIEELRSDVTDLKLQAASNRERLEAVRNETDSSLRMIEELKQKKTAYIAEAESIASKIAMREAEILEKDTGLRRFVSEADQLRAEISGRREEIDGENAELLTVEQGLKTMRQQISEVTSRISELDVARAEHKMKLENLAETVRTNYGIELETVELSEVTQEDIERLAELKNKVQEIGPVNLGSIEEYEELKNRYDFMTKQQDDLNKSIAELEEAISKINATTRKKLREAFDTLKEKFAEVFVTLFGGGRAELILTDESNILETGIDIVVQPPGKKLQNIHLLSGGEKALTALSLQFASFLIKPTPMCILDEADAPLDESNTDRYARMIAELSKDIQFIVVTHNRTTMSVGQHIYGATMEEPGVSKVISLQFEEAAAAV